MITENWITIEKTSDWFQLKLIHLLEQLNEVQRQLFKIEVELALNDHTYEFQYYYFSERETEFLYVLIGQEEGAIRSAA